MAVVFDPFTGQLIDVGPTGMTIGGPVAGADPNSVLIVDGAYTLQNVQLDNDGQLLIGRDGDTPLAANLTSSTLSTNPKRISITNGPGTIDLDLPQDISSVDSPEFAGLTLTGFSGPVKATAGVLSSSAIDLASAEVTGILPIANGGTNLSTTPTNGQLLIGNGTDYTLANITSSTLSTNPDRIIITNTAGGIDLDLPQDINTTSSPEFANLNLAPNGTIDLTAAGSLNIGGTNTTTLNIGTLGISTINIGDGVTPTNINLYGNTFYQSVVNLEVTDKNIVLNKNGAPNSSLYAGISIYDNGFDDAGYIQVQSSDAINNDLWVLKPPSGNGAIVLNPGSDDITIKNTGPYAYIIDNGFDTQAAITIKTSGTGVQGTISLDAETVYLNANVSGIIDGSNHKIENVANPTNPQDVVTLDYADNQYLPTQTFEDYNLVQKEPTGFADASESTISFNDINREFTIQPLAPATSYDIYIKGVKYTKTTAESVIISNNPGNHYIYFDATGTLTSTQVFSSQIITDYAFVSIIYWNTNTNSHTYFANERHGVVMDGMTHSYLHTVLGARYLSGGALQNFQVDGTGNSNADAQFTSDSGSIRDEDLLIQYLAQAQIPILYRIGTQWEKKTADSFPVIYSGTAGYTGSNGLLPYNQLSAGIWSLTEVQNNKFVLVHIFATNDVDNPVVGIQGIDEYNDVSSARTAALTEITTISGLPFAEFVALGSVVFETSTTYANTPKARVRSVNGTNYVDFRGTQPYAPQYATASSHSILSNLSSDDHLQYLNLDGSRPMAADLSLANYNITNLADPVNPQDAVNKRWIEDQLNDSGVTCYDISSLSLPSLPYTPDGVTLSNGDRVLFAFDNSIYEASGLPGTLTWTQDTSFIPLQGTVVSIKEGDVFGLQTAKFDGTDFQINNYVRYFNGSDYWEQSSPNALALLNNTTNNVFTISFANSENIIVDYSVIRNSNKITGTLYISTDGTDVAISDTGAELGDVGVTFDASISGTDILLDCITDNSGFAGSLKYSTRRWSDGAGGPAGLPSYSASTVVSSVGLSMPAEFTVTNSPVTSSGTLTVTKASQAANLFYASPNGSAGVPTFRGIAVADVPTLNQNTTGTASNVTGVVAIANGGTGQTTANDGLNALLPSQSTNTGKYLQTDGTNTSWVSVPTAKASYFDLVVGSAAQVTAGTADYSSLQSAINTLTTGGTILLLGTYATTENITMAYDNIGIYGQGNKSVINGTIGFSASVDHCVIDSVRITGNITFNAGNNYNYLTNFWVPNTVTITDNGTSNYIAGLQE